MGRLTVASETFEKKDCSLRESEKKKKRRRRKRKRKKKKKRKRKRKRKKKKKRKRKRNRKKNGWNNGLKNEKEEGSRYGNSMKFSKTRTKKRRAKGYLLEPKSCWEMLPACCNNLTRFTAMWVGLAPPSYCKGFRSWLQPFGWFLQQRFGKPG